MFANLMQYGKALSINVTQVTVDPDWAVRIAVGTPSQLNDNYEVTSGGSYELYLATAEATKLVSDLIEALPKEVITPILQSILDKSITESEKKRRLAMHRLNFDTDYDKHALDETTLIV